MKVQRLCLGSMAVLTVFFLEGCHSSASAPKLTGETSVSSTVDSNSNSNSNSSEKKTENFPYAVSLERILSEGEMKFSGGGANFPDSFSLKKSGNETLLLIVASSGGAATSTNNLSTFTLSVTNVPTKSIRIFGGEGTNHAVRTVKVNTKLTVTGPSAAGVKTNDVFYLFRNAQDSFSLAAPNYAGNVTADQADVLVECVQSTN